METKCILMSNENREGAIDEAALLLQSGKVVAIPTETVYGLAANAFDDEAVRGIFSVKGRPQDNPLIVHICDLMMLKKVTDGLPPQAGALAKRFWPGPLTIVLKKGKAVSSVVTCGLDSVAVRMPSQKTALALIGKAGVALAAPSANVSGRPSPTSAKHVYEDLNGKIPLILDDGPCEIGVESTVVTLLGEVPTILRPGMISLDDVREVLPNATMAGSVMMEIPEGSAVESPGMKYTHYAPRAELTLIKGTLEQFIGFAKAHAAKNTYAMCFDGEEERIGIPAISYGPEDRPDIQARRLFSVLRAVDRFDATKVLVRSPSETGRSLAVYNRLVRASGHRVVER